MDFVSFVPETMAPRDAYRLLVSSVVPRPIGWASTIGADGSVNLAPFSFFNAVGGPMPFVMISVSRRAGAIKDTLRNASETGEMVLNIVDENLAPQMNVTSGDWPYGDNEFERAGLAAAPSVDVRPPRVAAAPVSRRRRRSMCARRALQRRRWRWKSKSRRLCRSRAAVTP